MDGIEQSVRVEVGEAPIDAASLVAEVSRPGSGATVAFLGTVRDHSRGHTGVTHLEYEVYEEMVNGKIEEIAAEATDRWDVQSVVVQHRSGTVNLGEASVAVVVSAAHRGQAFDAAEYIIDQLKQRAPIWKKEHWPGGSEWSQGS